MSDLVGGAPSGAPPARAERFRLSDHVRSVAIGAETVLLDLREDKYLCVSTEKLARALAAGGEADGDQTLREALTRGELLRASGGASMALREPKQFALVGGANPVAFLGACLWARRQVRARRLDQAVSALASGKGESGEAKIAVARFRAWRPWYPARNVCLFDSLALARFLLGAGVGCELVFGVRLAPFAAHCWVEADGEVLNDEDAYCRSFTEILRSGR